MSGSHADVSFYSNVPEASVVIRNKRGEQVMVTQTQSKVALKRNDRYIFPARYTATFMAPGYQPVDVPIQSKVNPWVLGNVAVGGLAGLVVDNATGAAWTPKESSYYQALMPLGPTIGSAYSSTTPALGSSTPIYTAAAPMFIPPGGQTNRAAATMPETAAAPAVFSLPQSSPELPITIGGAASSSAVY
jgi:hypothetical protein